MDTKENKEIKNEVVINKEDEKSKIQEDVVEKIMNDSGDDNKDKNIKNNEKINYTPKIIAGAVVGLLILFILLIVVMGVGMYKFNWSNSVTKMLPFPAAMVDGKFISFNNYQNDIDTLKFFYSAQSESLGTIPSDDYIQKTVISRMIRENFLGQYAKKNNITVSQEEINKEYDVLVAQAGSEDEVNTQLLSLYNWTSDQFKEKVLEPYLVRSKVQDLLVSEDMESEKLANDVLNKIKNEEITFEDAAKEYSDDVTAADGGELGYFSSGQMVPEFEAAASALEVGQISDVVKTDYGYHIIKLLERVPATDTEPEQLNAAHILIQTPNIDEWTNEELSNLSIRLFINDYEWKNDCSLVLSKSETCDNNNLLDYLDSTNTTTTSTPTE